MVRKMVGIGFSYLAGLFFAYFAGYDVSFYFGISIIIISFICLIIIKHKKRITICISLISLAVGCIYYSLYGIHIYSNIVKYDGINVEINGEIISFSDYKSDKSSYRIKGKINSDITAEVILFADSVNCLIGDKVTFNGKAQVMNNSYTFSTESYYKAKGIYLQIIDVNEFKVTHDYTFSLRRTVHSCREYIYSVMMKILAEDESAVMSALLFGDKSGISDLSRTLLNRAGIGHIMAVSGVHLSVICSFIWMILSWTPLNKKIRFVIMMLPLFAFILLADMSVSVLRAAVMIIIVYSAELFKRHADTLNSLGIAVVILTLPYPFAITDASFLLSVACVFGIGVIAPIIISQIEKTVQDKQEKPLDGFEDDVIKFKLGNSTRSLISSVCAVFLLYPVTFLFFDEMSIISPISNLILLPLCTVILLCGVFVTFTGGVYFIAFPILKFCELCCKLLIIISEFIGGLRFTYIPLGYDFIKNVIIICFIVIIIGAVLMWHAKSTAVLSVLILGFSVSISAIYKFIPSDTVSITILKENNASVLIIHDKKSASIIDLYRGGKASGSVVKYLNRLGIYNIDALYLNTDSLTAYPIYKDSLRLFDVATVLIPEDDYLPGKTSGIGDNIIRYNNKDGSKIDMPYYTLEIEKDIVKSLCFNMEILLINGKKYNIGELNEYYNAIIYYNGDDFNDSLRSEIKVALSNNAVINVEYNERIYIGESVKLDLHKNGFINSEVILGGSSQ